MVNFLTYIRFKREFDGVIFIAITPLLKVWKVKSVFFNLSYFEILATPHSLDVMHITKNVCESLLGTLFNMPERMKDGPKARSGHIKLGIRDELHGGCEPIIDQSEETDGCKGKKVKQNDYYCPPPASL